MPSTLSYTITSSKNKFTKYYDYPFQILPTQRTPLNYLKFPELTDSLKQNSQFILHTGYDVRPFSKDILSSTSYQHILLKSYILSAKRLFDNSKSQLLIHGPASDVAAQYLTTTLPILKEYSENENVNICIEMPAFDKSLNNIVASDNFNFIEEYFKTIIEYGFEIVIDTAHLHSNGLTSEQMVKLLDEFKHKYTFVHLNGNARDMFKKDKHTIFNEIGNIPGFETNKIKNSEILLQYLGKANTICISEQKCDSIEHFTNYEKYGFNVIKNIPSELII